MAYESGSPLGLLVREELRVTLPSDKLEQDQNAALEQIMNKINSSN